MTFGPNMGVRITGAENARGRVRKFRVTTLARMKEEAKRGAGAAVGLMRSAMHAEYTSQDAGDLAAGLSMSIQEDENGLSVSFAFPGLRELSYVTALGGGYFSVFPVGPYEIYPQEGGRLALHFSDGTVVLGRDKPVTHPGFQSDVIANTGSAVLEALALNVTRAIDGSVAELVME